MVEQDYKDLILLRTGNRPVVEDNLDLIWKHHAAMLDMELRYNYALIESIEILLGGTWQNYDVTTSTGENMRFSQAFANLLKLCEKAQLYIDTYGGLEASYAADGAPTTADMIGYFPIETPELPAPDPNSTRYLGDPIWSWRGTR